MFTFTATFHQYVTRLLLNVNIGVRLFALMGVAVCVSLLLAVAGIWGMAAPKESLRSIYEDRLPAILQLTSISMLMANNQSLLLTSLDDIHTDVIQDSQNALAAHQNSGLISAHANADAIESNGKIIDSLWHDYMSSAPGKADTAFSRQFQKNWETYLREALFPAALAIRATDYPESKRRAVLASTLYLQINRQLLAAITYRIDSSEQTSLDGLKHFDNIRLIAFFALALAILLMSWLGLILTQSIVSPLKKVIAVFNHISDGHYNSNIRIIGKDEISKVMAALQAMQCKLGANELAIHQLAFYDPLTSLPNRRLLRDRLQRALSFSKRDHQFGAVLMIDLDNFKSINDTLGHDIGDLFLKEIALRLQSCLRQSDTVARMGGDEFIVMLANLNQHEQQAALQAQEIGEKILKSMAQPVMLGNQLQHRSASIGACLFRGEVLSIEELFKRADISMYEAKSNGRNNLRFYDPKIQTSLNQRNELEVRLHTALTEKQLRLYFQIQVDHIHGAIGAEVLLRWQHPIHGLVYPDQFIAIAEESSLIVRIGHWVLQTACVQLRSWAAHPLTEKLSLSVNVSARQFRQADFVDEVCRIVTQTGANPQRLKLELTESLVLHNVADTTEKMNKLNKIGIQFSMDDFGTGYSSLAHLSILPIQELKIDRSFVQHIPTNKRDTAIVQAIIGLAKNLGIAVIAEGVETEEQHLCLEHFGCQSYQGYLFGKAMPIEQFEKNYLPETDVLKKPPAELVLTI